MAGFKWGYSLDCSYFDKEFPSIDALYKYCVENGMDPNYEITFNGKGTGEELFEIMVGQKLKKRLTNNIQ